MTPRVGRGTEAAKRIRRTEASDVAVSKIVAVRLPDGTMARVQAHRHRLRELTGLEPSLSEVIKMLVERGLAAVEDAPQPTKKR